MATILEFPLWRSRRSPPAEAGLAAQIVIFPGIRIERDSLDTQPFLPLVAGPAHSPQRNCPKS
jgi:hypothetical protein